LDQGPDHQELSWVEDEAVREFSKCTETTSVDTVKKVMRIMVQLLAQSCMTLGRLREPIIWAYTLRTSQRNVLERQPQPAASASAKKETKEGQHGR
jgi:hypothetical protein